MLEAETTKNEYLFSILTIVPIDKDVEGQKFWPAYGINTIVTMKPGEGYQLNLANNVNYTCPVQGGILKLFNAAA